MFNNIFRFEIILIENSPLTKKTFYWSQQIVLLVFRVWLFNVFFFSGWLKLNGWETTLMLFEYEYSVPFISFEMAAYLATFSELLFPVLLLFGIFPRVSTLALLSLNIVAAISYADVSAAGLQQHILWSVIMVILFVYGGGRLGVDILRQQKRLNID